jgi:hypothetical protein
LTPWAQEGADAGKPHAFDRRPCARPGLMPGTAPAVLVSANPPNGLGAAPPAHRSGRGEDAAEPRRLSGRGRAAGRCQVLASADVNLEDVAQAIRERLDALGPAPPR